MFSNIILDEFIVVPNHLHGIIGFNGKPISLFTGKETNLGNIVKRFKLESMRRMQKYDGDDKWRSVIASTTKKDNLIWQKSYYDHVIRDEIDLHRVREYIQNNPLQWKLNELNPKNKTWTIKIVRYER